MEPVALNENRNSEINDQ